jgi:hypothetical protein
LPFGSDGVDGPLALELPEDVLVGHPDRVGEHVQPAAVRHAHHDVVRAGFCGELDRLVEHRDHHVEALERELLLPEEPLAQEPLHSLDLAEPAEKRPFLGGAERLPVAPRLDRLAEPDPLLMVGKVLELVRDRAAVGLCELGQDIGEGLPGDGDPQDGRRNASLQLGRQLGLEPERFERRVTDRLGTERIETGREVAVRAVRLDECHRRSDATEQLRVDGGCGRCRCRCRCRRSVRDGCAGLVAIAGAVSGRRQPLEQPGDPRVGGDELRIAALEQRSPLCRHGFRVVEVLVE